MSEVKVPDIGDFTDVPVIEILVAAGRHGRGRGPADHARVRQGDDGRPVAGRRHGQGAAASRSATRCPRARLILHARRGADGGRRRRRRTSAAPEAPPSPRRPRPRRPPRSRGRRRRRRPTWSCSAPAPAATPPRSAPPTSGSRPCWSSATSARRRLPERRLHPVEGAAAHRRACSPRPRSPPTHGITFGEPEIDLDALRALEGLRRRQAHRRARPAWPSSARSRSCAGRGTLHRRPTCSTSRARRHDDDRLRALHHRRRLAARPCCPACPTTTRGSWTRPARSSSPTSPSGCS